MVEIVEYKLKTLVRVTDSAENKYDLLYPENLAIPLPAVGDEIVAGGGTIKGRVLSRSFEYVEQSKTETVLHVLLTIDRF